MISNVFFANIDGNEISPVKDDGTTGMAMISTSSGRSNQVLFIIGDIEDKPVPKSISRFRESNKKFVKYEKNAKESFGRK